MGKERKAANSIGRLDRRASLEVQFQRPDLVHEKGGGGMNACPWCLWKSYVHSEAGAAMGNPSFSNGSSSSEGSDPYSV